MPDPVRSPTQARALRTRASLVRAARVEFSSGGYRSATAKRIAARAGVAVGTFYQYFKDKDAVLRELARERAEHAASVVAAVDLDVRLDDGPAAALAAVRARMRAVVRAVTEHHREDPGLHAVLTERRHVDPELDEVTSRMEAALVARVGALLERTAFPGDAEATAFVLFSMVEGAVHAHVLGRPVVSDERFFDALVDALVQVALPYARRTP